MHQNNINSINAYYNSCLPNLPRARKIVLDAIRELGEATDEQIAQHLGIGINRVSGRVYDLEKLDLIKCNDKGGKTAEGNDCRKSRINYNYGIEHANLRPEVKEKIIKQQIQGKLI
jgi:transcription initiation factor IIE alpha subunit